MSERADKNIMLFRICWLFFLLQLMSTIHPVRADDVGRGGTECGMSAIESKIAMWLLDHPKQQRGALTCDPELQAFARSRAEDMAERDYFGHVTPERVGPNELLRETGYEMPEYYVGGITNSVESILAGESSAKKVWNLFLDSPVHRRHLLGEDPMYEKQQQYGVAYYHKPASKYAHYWVIVIAEHGNSDRAMTCTPPPSICIVH